MPRPFSPVTFYGLNMFQAQHLLILILSNNIFDLTIICILIFLDNNMFISC